jgi:hypothetical protein
MGLVRKSSLYQLEEVIKLMKKDNKDIDIGKETTKDIKIEHHTGGDIEYDASYDMSNEPFGEYTFGNFGESLGDLTNDDENANLMSINNPLDKKNIDTLENFDVCQFWGDMWQNRDKQKVMKFDQPDSELFDKGKTKTKKKKKVNESIEYISESLKYVKRFNEM